MNIYSDSISDNDILGRESLSKRIATGLIRSAKIHSDGFVTALTGKWGSGKSTLLHFLKRDIEIRCQEESISYIKIEFNPWMFTDQDNIRVAILKQIALSLSGPKPRWKRWLLFGAPRLQHLELAHSGLGKLGKEAGHLIQNYLDTNNSIALKNKIDQLLIKANKKIFVFIDDIDRLSPKQIFEIFQVLKLTGNFKNTFYIIAYDREAIEIAIETQFEHYGKKYLDKITQADFLIPEAPDDKIEQLLFDGVDRICSDFQINYKSTELSSVWLHRGLRLYFATIRDVYRYLNSIQFSLPVIGNDVDITDFLILEAIRLHDYEAYQLIFSECIKTNILIGATINLSSTTSLERFPNETTKKLIEFLFPVSIIGSFHGVINKRLYDPKNSSRYFTLQLSNKDISESEFQKFMNSPGNRMTLLKDIIGLGRLENLLIRLNDPKLNEKHNAWNFSLLEEMYRFFNLYSDQIDRPHRYADAIINLLHQKKKEQGYYFNSFLQLLLNKPREIDNAKIYFCHFMLESKIKDNGFPHNHHEFKSFYIERYDEIRNSYLEFLSIHQHYFFQSGKIQNWESYYTLLYVWDFATWYTVEYFSYAINLVIYQINVPFYLKNMLMISTDGEVGRVDIEKLEKLLPNEDLQKSFARTLKSMDITKLTEEQQNWREFALDYFGSLLK